MCRFLKFIPSKASLKFAIKYKNAFVLLLIIAERARRTNGEPDGLTVGQCHLGNHKNYGMTEKEYRYAKQVLVEQGLIKIVVTNRTRKKANQTKKLFDTPLFGATAGVSNTPFGATAGATELTTAGTLVELCNSDIWDINSEGSNHQKGDRKGDLGATEVPLRGDKQERKKEKKKEKEESIAQPAPRLRSKDPLSFDFDRWEFVGITPKDESSWALMFPHVDLKIETLKAIEWLKENPSKQKKTLWRRFLTGWFRRANDWAENKKAYQSRKETPATPTQEADSRQQAAEDKKLAEASRVRENMAWIKQRHGSKDDERITILPHGVSFKINNGGESFRENISYEEENFKTRCLTAETNLWRR